MHNWQKVLSEKYQNVKESEKQDIMGGLDAAADYLSRQAIARKKAVDFIRDLTTVFKGLEALEGASLDKELRNHFLEIKKEMEAGNEEHIPEEDVEFFYAAVFADDNIKEISRNIKF